MNIVLAHYLLGASVLITGSALAADVGSQHATTSRSYVADPQISGDWTMRETSILAASFETHFTGHLSTVDQRISGLLFVTTSRSSCYPWGITMAVTGAIDREGHFKIVSSPIDNQVFAATGIVS